MYATLHRITHRPRYAYNACSLECVSAHGERAHHLLNEEGVAFAELSDCGERLSMTDELTAKFPLNRVAASIPVRQTTVYFPPSALA